MFLGFDWGKNVVIFRAENSSLVHIDNKKKDILVFGEGPTQWVDNTLVSGKAKHSTNILRSQRNFCLSLHYNESKTFLFVNATKIYQFKVKNFEIKQYQLCSGNISKDFTANNIKIKQD